MIALISAKDPKSSQREFCNTLTSITYWFIKIYEISRLSHRVPLIGDSILFAAGRVDPGVAIFAHESITAHDKSPEKAIFSDGISCIL